MKKLLLIALLFGCANFTLAQTIERYSIDSGGASISSGGIEILYTIGEVNVRELSAGNFLISEGFINSFASETLEHVEMPITETEIRVFPNPTSDYINIQSNKQLDTVELYNLLGKRLLQTTNNRIHIIGLNSGIYILNILSDNKNISKKIIIE